ncbi:hypothetical protein C8R44DRAFT_992627 [Mycena epipterygia]|nr:hypothetical protein C8R44DRAFT_992858 [Mycena epipterygia]KAJ7079181.1 hypothetical protein C8R44DRAFT_992627 [Mycena epipterygia]
MVGAARSVDGEGQEFRHSRGQSAKRIIAPVRAYEAVVVVHASGLPPPSTASASPLPHFPIKRSQFSAANTLDVRVRVNEGVRGARIARDTGCTRHDDPGCALHDEERWGRGSRICVGGRRDAPLMEPAEVRQTALEKRVPLIALWGRVQGRIQDAPGTQEGMVSSPHTSSLSVHGDAIPVHTVAGRYTRGGFLHVFPTSFPGIAASSGRPHARLLIGTGTRVALVTAVRSTTNAGAGVSVDVTRAGMHRAR